MANCFYIQIKDLTLSSHSFFINALIIAKTEKKFMNSQRSNGGKVGVLTFTVRDTKEHFINCTVWGSEQFIDACDRAYKIGQVVGVYHPMVSQKNDNSSYRPRTSSPFELTVNESKAFLHRSTDDCDHLLQLNNQAIKPTNLTLYLSDLDTHPESGQLNVDLVVMGEYFGILKSNSTKVG